MAVIVNPFGEDLTPVAGGGGGGSDGNGIYDASGTLAGDTTVTTDGNDFIVSGAGDHSYTGATSITFTDATSNSIVVDTNGVNIDTSTSNDSITLEVGTSSNIFIGAGTNTANTVEFTQSTAVTFSPDASTHNSGNTPVIMFGTTGSQGWFWSAGDLIYKTGGLTVLHLDGGTGDIYGGVGGGDSWSFDYSATGTNSPKWLPDRNNATAGIGGTSGNFEIVANSEVIASFNADQSITIDTATSDITFQGDNTGSVVIDPDNGLISVTGHSPTYTAGIFNDFLTRERYLYFGGPGSANARNITYGMGDEDGVYQVTGTRQGTSNEFYHWYSTYRCVSNFGSVAANATSTKRASISVGPNSNNQGLGGNYFVIHNNTDNLVDVTSTYFSFDPDANEFPVIIGGTTIDASAALNIISTTQGFLPPRMTNAQMDAISSPATGLQVYDNDTGLGLSEYNGTNWVGVSSTIITDVDSSSVTTVNVPAYAAKDLVYIIDTTTTNVTVNLPAVADFGDNKIFIKKADNSGNSITVDGNASEEIDGATTQAISAAFNSMTIVRDEAAAAWHII